MSFPKSVIVGIYFFIVIFTLHKAKEPLEVKDYRVSGYVGKIIINLRLE